MNRPRGKRAAAAATGPETATGDGALDLLAALILHDGHRWGECAVDWQWGDARAALDQHSPTPYHLQTRPRGASKTTDAAGVAVTALLSQLPPGASGFVTAADRDQAQILIGEAAGFARRTDLLGALDIGTWRITAIKTGASITALAADGPSAWGLRPALFVADELAQWPDTINARQVWEAGLSAMPKTPGARLLVLTTAGDPTHWSHAILEHARSSPRWRVSETPGPTPWLDPADLAEQRALLPESSYRRLHLNEWVAAEDRLTNLDDLRACIQHSGALPPERGRRYTIGLDIGLVSDRTVAAVCHLEQQPVRVASPEQVLAGADAQPWRPAARVVLDRLEVWQGRPGAPVQLETVEAWLLETWHLYGRPTVRFDPYQCIGTTQRLESRGVRCEPFTFSPASVGQLGSVLHRLLRDRLLALPDDAALLEELSNVRLRETSPGVLRLDHDSGKHDDRAVALAMAAHHLLERPLPETRRLVTA